MVIQHGNGTWTIYRGISMQTSIHSGFSMAMFDYQKVVFIFLKWRTVHLEWLQKVQGTPPLAENQWNLRLCTSNKKSSPTSASFATFDAR